MTTPERYGFCWNSRRWLVLGGGFAGGSCPYTGGVAGDRNCNETCAYYEAREATHYLLRKLR